MQEEIEKCGRKWKKKEEETVKDTPPATTTKRGQVEYHDKA